MWVRFPPLLPTFQFMISKNPIDNFEGDKKIVSFIEADINIPTPRAFGEGLAFQFEDDETHHRSEICTRKSEDGKYVLISITRTTNDPNELAASDIMYSMEQIACLKWALEQLADPELETIYKKVEDEYV